MIIQIHSFDDKDELFKKAMQIRYTVFIEEQHVDKNLEYDGLDFESIHFIVIVDDKPIATARYRETEEGVKIERMAVLKEYRNLAYGHLLLSHILKDVKPSKQKIYLSAQQDALNFYKTKGFKIDGDQFLEANIKHYKMIYEK